MAHAAPASRHGEVRIGGSVSKVVKAAAEAGRPAGGARTRLAMLVDRHFKLITLLPALVLLLALSVYPVIELVHMSLSSITFEGGQAVWRPAFSENWATLVGDWIYRRALFNTLIFVAASTSLEMILGFALALAVSELVRGRNLVRTAMLLPILVPPVAIGSMWRLMYNPQFGVINSVLGYLGIPPLDLLGSTSTALLAVIIVDVWHWTPLVFLILLAGMEALPRDMLEAASIDGATYRQKLRYIIVPLMWPALMVAFIFRSIVAFKVFDQIFLLTSGGPGTSTEVVSLYVYKVFFRESQLGYGALLALLTIAIICAYLGAFALAQWRLRSRRSW